MDKKIFNKFSNEADIIYECNDTVEFSKKIPDNSIDLIITSPPYNIGKEYETRTSITNYISSQNELIIELARILKNTGSICWQVGNYIDKREIYPLDIFYYNLFKAHNLKLRNRIIWHFEHGLHAKNRFSGRYETVLWFTKTDNYTFNLDDVRVQSKYPGKRHYKGANKGELSGNPKGKNPSDIWEILQNDWDKEIWDIPNVKSNHVEKTKHPCQFPVELVERFVLALTNKGDIVFDPYVGVGTSCIAALKNDRRVYGVDKCKEYVDIGIKRINDFFNGDLKLRPMNKPIYVPSGNDKVSKIPEEWLTGDSNGN